MQHQAAANAWPVPELLSLLRPYGSGLLAFHLAFALDLGGLRIEGRKLPRRCDDDATGKQSLTEAVQDRHLKQSAQGAQLLSGDAPARVGEWSRALPFASRSMRKGHRPKPSRPAAAEAVDTISAPTQVPAGPFCL